MMEPMSDEDLLRELQQRFEQNKRALHDLQMATRNLERMNDKLLESETLKSNFISNIKNELNNPLTSLLILAKEMLGEDDLDRKTFQALARSLYDEMFTLDFHLRNIFAAAEIESGQVALSMNQVNIDELVRNTVDGFKHIIEKRRLDISVQWLENEEEIFVTCTDAEKLQIILSNILWNSIEYSEDGAKILVKAWITGQHINIIIEDSGLAIPEGEVTAMFSGFRHLAVDLVKRERGSCLGMGIMKAYVDLLGGTVSVAGSEDKGCVFSVYLPAAEQESGTSAASDGNEFFFDDGANGVEKF